MNDIFTHIRTLISFAAGNATWQQALDAIGKLLQAAASYGNLNAQSLMSVTEDYSAMDLCDLGKMLESHLPDASVDESTALAGLDWISLLPILLDMLRRLFGR